MKTKDELNALKEEVETMNKKLAELNEDEMAQVTGGTFSFRPSAPEMPYGSEYIQKELRAAGDLAYSRGSTSELFKRINYAQYNGWTPGHDQKELIEAAIACAQSWSEYETADILQHLNNAYNAYGRSPIIA